MVRRMITIEIPGNMKIEARDLVLDFNGTLAIDGKLIEGVRELLLLLAKKLKIHVITADTFGTSKQEMEGIPCKLEIIGPSSQDKQKEDYVLNLGKTQVISIGNGKNDMPMLDQAALGIMVIEKEGAFAQLTLHADIICFSITDALNLLLNPIRIAATCRN
jgi:soluble P-type ATPase